MKGSTNTPYNSKLTDLNTCFFVNYFRDGDGIVDSLDNCPAYANGDQSDIDGDGTGMFRPQGYKTFFILNSAEHEIYPAHKC